MVTVMPSPLMHVWERRALTAGEVDIGRGVFGDGIDWARVRVLQAPALPFGAMVPFGKTIVFGRWRAARDFARASPGEQGWFVHELAHVWQASRKTLLAVAKLDALGKKAYVVKPRAGAKLRDYNIEAQAEIARHVFLSRAGGQEAGALDKVWLEDIWAKR